MSKILIIEDEEAIADLEKDYLELSGFEVEIANRGDVGLEKALNEDYDLIILDLMLPEVDGFDICRQVRQEKSVGRSEMRRTHQSLWYQQKKMILIRSVDSVLARMII